MHYCNNLYKELKSFPRMKIVVYGHREDPYSDMLKNLLRYYNVTYDNIEVSKNPEAMANMTKISGQKTTPVIVVDGKVFVGFDRQKIKELLGLPQQQ